jgi:dihydroorotate dehydrogenase (NAD+) catalytic subunit
MPRCIYIDPVRNFALNAVGLSGPGAEFLFKKNLWQQRREFFFLSFMAVGQTREERMTEFKRFLELLTFFLPGFQTAIGLQINISCPNVGMKMQTLEIVEEVKEMLSLLLPFKIVVVLKTDPLFDPDAATMISRHPGCHAITPSNTIAFDKLSGSDQKWLFESGRSPLRRFKGGGGLSGDPLRRYAVDATRKFFMAGIRKPIIGGGGITDLYHVSEFYMSGAAGVQLGSVRFLRPYRVAKIIGFADRWA